MTYVREPQAAVLYYLHERKTARLSEVIRHFRHLTFNQVLFAIDQLNRAGKIHVTKQTPWQFVLSQIRCTLHGGNQEDEGRQDEATGETTG